jgi:hypothetical protein
MAKIKNAIAPPSVTDTSVSRMLMIGAIERLTNAHTDFAGNGPAAKHSYRSAATMPNNSTTRNPPIVRASGHGDGRNLAPIAPFAEESHNECLHPGWTQQERQEVIETCHCAGQARTAR